MKKIRGNKPIVVKIHTWKYHKEAPSAATFISNKLQCHVFHFIFFPFPSTKLENRTKSPAHGEWSASVGGEEMLGKGNSRMNMVQKYVHMYVNAKMIPFKTTPGIGGR
jgi:hypothetical protein